LQRHLQNRKLKNGYDRTLGIDNVNYGDNNYGMICETIFTLAENFPNQYRSGDIDTRTQAAVRQYIDKIYDSNWKKQMDEWIITEGIMRLHLSGIPFLLVPCLLWPWDPDNATLWRHCVPDLVPDRSVMHDDTQSPLAIAGANHWTGSDPGYHTNARGQEIMAQNWLDRMRKDFQIT